MSDRIDAMARAYVEEGLSYSQIGDRYGVTRQRVGQLLGPLGLAQGQQSRTVMREQKLRAAHARLLTGGTTMAEEADVLGYASAESLRSAFYNLNLRFVQEREIPPHGTMARYRSQSHGCSCEECRRANREHQNLLRGQEPPSHGTYSGYVNYGCRCKPCKEAHRATVRMQRAERRKRKEVKV